MNVTNYAAIERYRTYAQSRINSMATMRKTATSQSATNKTSTNKRAANSNNDIAAVLTLSSNRNTSFFKTVT